MTLPDISQFPPTVEPSAVVIPQAQTVEPYPEPTDTVVVAVYDTATGHIRQTVQCALQDEHRQHDAWPGCDYIEVTGQNVSCDLHAVELSTRTIIPRTVPTPADRSTARDRLNLASRMTTFTSSATGSPLAYTADVQAIALAAVVGGDLEADGVHVQHTAEQAMAVARDLAAARSAVKSKLDGLLAQVAGAATLDQLRALVW